MPQGNQQTGKVLLLEKSMCVLREAPQLLFDLLRERLKAHDFCPSCYNPHLFINHKMKVAVVVQVDNCLYFAFD